MDSTGLICIGVVAALSACALAGGLIAVVWRVCRSNERLSDKIIDLSLARPYHILSRQKDGSVSVEREGQGRSLGERNILASASLEKARATRDMIAASSGAPLSDDEEVDERMPT